MQWTEFFVLNFFAPSEVNQNNVYFMGLIIDYSCFNWVPIQSQNHSLVEYYHITLGNTTHIHAP